MTCDDDKFFLNVAVSSNRYNNKIVRFYYEHQHEMTEGMCQQEWENIFIQTAFVLQTI